MWTGDALSDRMLALAGFDPRDLRRMLRTFRKGMQATLPAKHVRRQVATKDGALVDLEEHTAGGAPDWPARLRAAESIADLASIRGSRKLEPAPAERTTVSVTIVHESPAPRAALPAGGVVIHHEGGDANGAGP